MREFRGAFNAPRSRSNAAPERSENISRVLLPGYVPGYKCKYYRCKKFLSTPFVCPVARRHCKACAFYAESFRHPYRAQRGTGLMDWTDPKQRRAYHRERMRKKREEAKRQATEGAD
jgi:hypothetical protein